MDVAGDAIQSSRHLSREDRVLVVFVRLKMNMSFAAMSSLFSVRYQTLSKVFFETLEALYAAEFILNADELTNILEKIDFKDFSIHCNRKIANLNTCQ